AEPAQQRWYERYELTMPRPVARDGWKRDVNGRALRARLVREARAGEERPRRLVDADGQHAGVVVEGGLDAVAVVDVDVDVGDALGAVLQQPRDRDGGVVVDAEPAGGAGQRVVQAAGDVEGVLGAPGPHRLGRGDGRARDQGGRVVHADEHRVVGGAEPVAELGEPGRAGVLHRRDVGLLVDEPEQLVVRGV